MSKLSRLNLKLVLRIAFVFVVFASCSDMEKKDIAKSEDLIVALVDSIKIEYSEIDEIVIQELYDQLYKMYRIRSIALNGTIEDRILQLEANKQQLSKTEYIDKSLIALKEKISFKTFCEKYFKNEPLISKERQISYYDIKSEKGKELALKSYNNYLKDILIDSLKNLHDIKVFLEPPLPPKIDFNLLDIEEKGNLNSDVFVLLIADLECTKCTDTELIYEKLVEIYQDKVKFGYISYASYVNLSILALNSASKQDKYWEMKDEIKSLSELPDTVTIFRIAKNIGLDSEKFKTDFKDKELKAKIEKDFEIIRRYGIYVVPTILVSGRLVYDPSSMEEIEGLIKEELKK